MKVSFFIRSKIMGNSIQKHFDALIAEIGKTENVQSYFMPSYKFNLYSIINNLWYTYKHRDALGVNHIAGDCYYIIFALLGCKTVITVHDLGFYVSHKKERNFLQNFLLYYLQIYWPIKLADRVVANSEKTKQEILNTITFKKDIYIAKHISVDTFKYSPKKFDKENPVVLQIGTGSNKNLETTIKAVAIMGLPLRIIRKMTPEQVSLAQSLNIDYVNLCNLSDEDLYKEYQNADIICFPSLYEGFGAIIIEAQATGRPVITTDREPMSSVSGRVAYLMKNPTDVEELRYAIKKIIDDECYRKKMIEEGRKNAAKYSVKACSREYLSIYNSF